jgi:hypothetical protein
MKLNICHHRILAFRRMFLCLTHNAINITLFVGSSDLYLEDEDDEFGKFNDKHECLATITNVLLVQVYLWCSIQKVHMETSDCR